MAPLDRAMRHDAEDRGEREQFDRHRREAQHQSLPAPGRARSRIPASAKNRADSARLVAATSAPSVSTVQYTRNRLNLGRAVLTRQMRLNVASTLVERDQQRHHERDDAGRGQLSGVRRKALQVGLDRTRRTGHEVGEDVVAELIAPVLEHRERRQHAEDHHRQRHQREHGGERQRPGRFEQAVVEESTPHEAEERMRAGAVAQPIADHRAEALVHVCEGGWRLHRPKVTR